jgi:hypothetical protein
MSLLAKRLGGRGHARATRTLIGAKLALRVVAGPLTLAPRDHLIPTQHPASR